MSYHTVLEQFESATLQPFGHREHILIAWLYLNRDGWEQGYQHIRAGLKHFAVVHGAPDKYHETITHFWAMLVQHCIDDSKIDDFEGFIAVYPILLDKSAIKRYFSVDLLKSSRARLSWVEPDLAPIPTR